MVGRSPEYLRKRIEAKNIKMVMLALLAAAAANLLISCATFLSTFGRTPIGTLQSTRWPIWATPVLTG